MSEEEKIGNLIEELAAIEAGISPLRAGLRRTLVFWLVAVVTIVGLAIGGGLGYTLSWIVGLTALMGVVSLPRLGKLRALERERDQLLLKSGYGERSEPDIR